MTSSNSSRPSPESPLPVTPSPLELEQLLNDLPSPQDLERAIQAERARRRAWANLADFFRTGWHVLEPSTPLEWNWHLQALCDHIQAQLDDWMRAKLLQTFQAAPMPGAEAEFDEVAALAARTDPHNLAEARRLGLMDAAAELYDPARVLAEHRRKIQNLLINVPPGTGKSRVVSVYTPAWMWLHWPAWRSIFLSVNPRSVIEDSVRCRDLMRSDWYQASFTPEWDFAEDQDAKGLFKNTKGGFRMALGYFAQIIGGRGDSLFIDDPNDPEEVHAEAARESVISRYSSTLRHRVNDLRSSTKTVIQQRVHIEDLSGHLLKEEGDDWEHLCIAMEKEEPERRCDCQSCRRGETAIGWRDPRKPGEIMFPGRYPFEVLDAFKKDPYLWAAQWQQRPIPAVGNMFREEWWWFWRRAGEPESPDEKIRARTVILPERFDKLGLSWDCSFKDTASSSKVAGGVWGALGAQRYLLELEWDRMGFPETSARFEKQAKAWPQAMEKFVEDKANGTAVIQTFKSKIPGIIPVEPAEYGSKPARAAATSPYVLSGCVFLPLWAPWRARYIKEHTSFPSSERNDVVDQQSQILLKWHVIATPGHSQRPGQYGSRRA